jgi:hypothetical protein
MDGRKPSHAFVLHPFPSPDLLWRIALHEPQQNHNSFLTANHLSVVNAFRQVRIAEILSDFRTLQYYIAAVQVDPDNMDDYYTEGWAALRQCAIDGQHILNCAADTSVPRARGGVEEQEKAELQQ